VQSLFPPVLPSLSKKGLIPSFLVFFFFGAQSPSPPLRNGISFRQYEVEFFSLPFGWRCMFPLSTPPFNFPPYGPLPSISSMTLRKKLCRIFFPFLSRGRFGPSTSGRSARTISFLADSRVFLFFLLLCCFFNKRSAAPLISEIRPFLGPPYTGR